MPNAPTIDPDFLEAEGNWYDDAFAPGATPSFADFLRAHIDSDFRIVDDAIRECEPGECTQLLLPGNFGVLFYSNTELVGDYGVVTCIISYLYDNHACTGPAKAGAMTFIMQVDSGNEKDIFRTLDRTKWSEISSGFFGLLQNYPATTCRLFAAGAVGYSVSSLSNTATPDLRQKLVAAICEHALPMFQLAPLVMLYDRVAPGYHYPADFMREDYARLNPTDQLTARALMASRAADDEAYLSWLRREMHAFPIERTDLSMAVLDIDRYSDMTGLFLLDRSTLGMTPSHPEPRGTPLSLDEYLDGKFSPLAPEEPENAT
jgi:hypothetical protein